METGLLIGCFGYDYPQWSPDPYPEELPPEWRFCYYSNEVRSVVLPAALLADADDGQIEGWARDSDEAFRFVLELTPGLLGAQPEHGFAALRRRLTPIEQRLAAAMVIEQASESWLTSLAQSTDLPLCGPGNGATSGRVWRPADLPGTSISQEGILLALVKNCEIKQLRFIIERLQQQHADTGLFFCEPASAWQQVKQAQQLADLMGVATQW